MEVYDALYNSKNKEIRTVKPTIVDESTYADLLQDQVIVFGGNGAAKCKEVIKHNNAVFLENFNPSATWMAPLAEKTFRDEAFEDVAYFEPFYLKAYIAGKSRVKGLYD